MECNSGCGFPTKHVLPQGRKEMMDFKDLENKSMDELKTIRDRKRNKLAEKNQEKFNMIGQILFYQNETDKES